MSNIESSNYSSKEKDLYNSFITGLLKSEEKFKTQHKYEIDQSLNVYKEMFERMYIKNSISESFKNDIFLLIENCRIKYIN